MSTSGAFCALFSGRRRHVRLVVLAMQLAGEGETPRSSLPPSGRRLDACSRIGRLPAARDGSAAAPGAGIDRFCIANSGPPGLACRPPITSPTVLPAPPSAPRPGARSAAASAVCRMGGFRADIRPGSAAWTPGQAIRRRPSDVASEDDARPEQARRHGGVRVSGSVAACVRAPEQANTLRPSRGAGAINALIVNRLRRGGCPAVPARDKAGQTHRGRRSQRPRRRAGAPPSAGQSRVKAPASRERVSATRHGQVPIRLRRASNVGKPSARARHAAHRQRPPSLRCGGGIIPPPRYCANSRCVALGAARRQVSTVTPGRKSPCRTGWLRQAHAQAR